VPQDILDDVSPEPEDLADFRMLYFHFETPRKFGIRSLQNAGGFSTGMERRAIAAKLRYVISYTRFRNRPGLGIVYTSFMNEIY
jgi:hypothetical protein